jgi:hypothetical protein
MGSRQLLGRTERTLEWMQEGGLGSAAGVVAYPLGGLTLSPGLYLKPVRPITLTGLMGIFTFSMVSMVLLM